MRDGERRRRRRRRRQRRGEEISRGVRRSSRLTTDTLKATGKSMDLGLESIRGQDNKEKHTETLCYFSLSYIF